MRACLLVTCLLVSSALPPAVPEETIQGRWRDGERGLLVEFSKGADGTWSAVILESPRKKEVGKQTFQKLRFDPATRVYTGLLLKPDDDDIVQVTVTLRSEDSMEAVARKWFLKKTLSLQRQRAP